MAFKKYPKVRRPGHSKTDGLFDMDEQELIITEKLDGNNFRFQRDGDELRFGSRNVDLGTDPEQVGGMFEQVSDYLVETVDPEKIEDLEELWTDMYHDCDSATLTLFGENAVQHTISEYDWNEVPQFNLFDVYVTTDGDSDGTWLRWGLTDEERERQLAQDDVVSEGVPLTFMTVEDVADYLGLTTTPVVEWTTVGEYLEENDLEDWDAPTSVYREDDGPAEGVVFRNPATGVKAKRISDEFAERHGSSSSTDNTEEDTDHEKFLKQHATKNRIEKNIGKMLEAPDNGYDELEMEMMEDLHLKVWRDIWAEDYEEIIANKWTLNLGNLHNTVASRCAEQIQELMRADEMPVSVIDPDRGQNMETAINDATDDEEVKANA